MKRYAEEYSQDLLNKWQEVQTLIDGIEPKFKRLLRKSISKSTDISKVKYEIQRKSLSSTVDKYKRKNRSIDTFSDLLRAVVVINSKVNLKDIISGLKYYFNISKIDVKEQDSENPYGNAIHVDVLCDGLVCEIQIMSRQMYTYKQVADKIYKSDLPDEDKKKLQQKWFNRGILIEKAVKNSYFLSCELYNLVKMAI